MYLDNAATSFPKPDCVTDAVIQWMKENGAAYGRASHSSSLSSTELVEQCRRQAAALLGVPSPEHIAFTFNCTDSLNLLLRGLLNPGDRILTTRLEHNSVLRPLTQLTREMNLDVDYTRFDPASGVIDLDDFHRRLWEDHTLLVVVSHASNVTGVVQPVEEIRQLAHAAGALLLVDAAQTAGHFPLNMQQLDIDFLATAGHKGLLGPLGTGLLAIRPGLEQLVRPVRCGGTGTSSESLEQPTAMPGRLESGNLNVPGIAGLRAAVEWLRNETVEQIHRHVGGLAEQLRCGLRALPAVRLLADAGSAPRTGIVAFNLEGLDCREAAAILEQSFDIQCRAGLHCAPLTHEVLQTASWGGAIRMSPGYWNTPEEIDTVIESVGRIAEAFEVRS